MRYGLGPLKTITAFKVEKIGKETKDLNPMIEVGLFLDGPFDFALQKGAVDILLGRDNIKFHPMLWDQRAGLILSRSRLGARRMLVAGKVNKSCLWLSIRNPLPLEPEAKLESEP